MESWGSKCTTFGVSENPGLNFKKHRRETMFKPKMKNLRSVPLEYSVL